MPEWPEVHAWAAEADRLLRGAVVASVWARDEKALNLPADCFNSAVQGKTIAGARNIGKWLLLDLDGGYLAFNFNMGADFSLGTEPMERARLRICFEDERILSVRFWFLGYLCFSPTDALCGQLSNLGPDCMQVSREEFCALLKGKRNLKTLLLDQRTVCGIGNFYIHDLLFLAGLHPQRRAESLSQEEKLKLYEAMHALFEKSMALGGAFYEHGLSGKQGMYNELLVAYGQERSCPVCGGAIDKLRVGGSHVYVCANCQH